ncbi:hypothetical protein PV327_006918 [Microctonus hyperodae]|uniref:CFA20 domain-containing protein n=1 Tax=Microctonus hyperodae TaxID=165561 RepID=A0AA39F5D6_MICHY|nr:hypothetical protein PV327_006918 [Microctonus hyperodae]
MFRDKYQKGYLSILYSCGPSPLELWGTNVENGYIRRVTDNEINSLALEVAGTNVSTTYIYTPKDRKDVLGIELCFLIMVVKNMKKYFTFEVTILDDKKMHRRFRVSNFQSATKIRPFSTSMPMGLSGGWNQIQFNLAEFCKKIYGSNYIETTRMQVHANCRIRRIYFADRLYQEDELPEEYKISGLLRKCIREDQRKQKKHSSKGSLARTSNQSQILSAGQEEAESLSTIVSETAEKDQTPVEQTKLEIDIPAPEYDETDNLSTEREFVNRYEIIEQQHQSELSLGGSPEDSKDNEF